MSRLSKGLCLCVVMLSLASCAQDKKLPKGERISVLNDFSETVSLQQNNIAKIPKNLPVFLIAGEEDPVGNYGKAVKNVYEIYKKAGIKDISIKLYKNERHELINETDKEDVYDDIRHWLICHL